MSEPFQPAPEFAIPALKGQIQSLRDQVQVLQDRDAYLVACLNQHKAEADQEIERLQAEIDLLKNPAEAGS